MSNEDNGSISGSGNNGDDLQVQLRLLQWTQIIPTRLTPIGAMADTPAWKMIKALYGLGGLYALLATWLNGVLTELKILSAISRRASANLAKSDTALGKRSIDGESFRQLKALMLNPESPGPFFRELVAATPYSLDRNAGPKSAAVIELIHPLMLNEILLQIGQEGKRDQAAVFWRQYKPNREKVCPSSSPGSSPGSSPDSSPDSSSSSSLENENASEHANDSVTEPASESLSTSGCNEVGAGQVGAAPSESQPSSATPEYKDNNGDNTGIRNLLERILDDPQIRSNRHMIEPLGPMLDRTEPSFNIAEFNAVLDSLPGDDRLKKGIIDSFVLHQRMKDLRHRFEIEFKAALADGRPAEYLKSFLYENRELNSFGDYRLLPSKFMGSLSKQYSTSKQNAKALQACVKVYREYYPKN